MTMPESLPPALILVAAAVLTGPARGTLRAAVVLLAPLLTLYAVWQVPDGVAATAPFLDYELQIVEGSPVRRLFATVFSIMAFAGSLFAFRQARWNELSAALLYAAGAVGVAFAGDLLTLFVFWELMALFSTVLIWCGGTPAARSAGIRYGIMHLLGGVLLKVGIEGIAVHTGSVDIAPLAADNFDRWMVLIGVLVNAAAPPVSAWLSDAYPESSPTGTVFLSAFTTKTALLALILMFPGETLLVGVGLYMVMYGILYALLENDVRRLLAFSVVNQVGFMVCAVGIGTPMALNGAAAHAFAHILFQALLFMSAGVVVYRTGRNLCTDLGGLYRTMPLTAACAVVGALAISGFPLTSGFTTRTLISQAAVDQHLAWVWFLLSAASAGVFLHAGLKLPWFVFFQRDAGMRPADAPWNMAAAMVLTAALCLLLGVFPAPLYALLPYPVEYDPYTPGKVLFHVQLLLFSGLAFFILLPLMQPTRTVSLDTDWLWRVAAARIVAWVAAAGGRLGAIVAGAGRRLRRRVGRLGVWLFAGARPDREGPGLFARPWSIGTTALWIALLLSLYVCVYFGAPPPER